MNRESKVFDRKKFIVGIGILLIAYSLGFKLPYTDRSISQMLIPAIRYKGSALYLSGLLILVILVYGAHLIVESGRYKSQLTVTLILLFIGIPLMMSVFDVVTSPIYLMSSGVKTLKIKESDFHISQDNDEVKLDFSAKVRSYKEDDGWVNIYLRVPNVIEDMVTESEILVYEANRLSPQKEWEIDISADIELNSGVTVDDLYNTGFYNENYILILEDDEQRLELEIYDSL